MGRGGSKPGERRGGRKKGTINRNTAKARDIIEAENYGAIKELIRVARLAEKEYERAEEIYDAIQKKRATLQMIPLTNDKVLDCLKVMQKSAADIAPYIHPRLKAISFQDGEGNDIQTFAELIAASVGRGKNAAPKDS